MFVHEDPGKKLSARERALTDSSVKSYLSSRRHCQKLQPARNGSQADKVPIALPPLLAHPRPPLLNCSLIAQNPLPHKHLRIPPDTSQANFDDDPNDLQRHPWILPRSLHPTLPDETFEEGRSIQFFIERTAREWSGWYDSHFWRVLALQASTLHSCIRHGLVSLAAVHEALEMPTEKLRVEHNHLALQQGNQAIHALLRDYSNLSLTSIFIAHLLIFAFTCFLNKPASFDAMRLTYDLDEQFRERATAPLPSIPQTDRLDIVKHVQPIIARQKSKHAQLADLIWALRSTDASHFDLVDRLRMPTSFLSIDHARSSLEQLLNWTTFQAKIALLPPNTLPLEAERHMTLWSSALDNFQRSHENLHPESHICGQHDKLNIQVLRLSAKVFFIMIKCMNSDSELIFDSYIDVYKEVLHVYKAVITYRSALSRTNFSLSTEASLLTFLGNIACRWCRDPKVRRELIALLFASNAVETHESGRVWAHTAQHLQRIEENGIVPAPQTAADIPEEKRVQFDAASFYMKAGFFGIRYIRYPFTPDSKRETIYVAHPGCESYLKWEVKTFEPEDHPDFIIARGSCSWLKPASSSDFYSLQEPKFYFNVPRV